MKRLIIVFFITVCVSFNIYSQDQEGNDEAKINETVTDTAEATNFSIPSSPAFVLLDVNPSKVNRPGSLRDFKFDWILKGDGLAPDIAIEFQPISLIFFNKVNYADYQKQWIKRVLSTLNISVGTAKKDDIQSIAYSLKITLINNGDPLSRKNTSYINEIKTLISDTEKKLLLRRAAISNALKYNTNLAADEKVKYEEEKKYLESKIAIIEELDEKELKKIKAKHEKDQWNATVVDVGFGQIFNYTGDTLDTLKFEGRGIGLWVNGCTGIGKRAIISGLFKYIRIDKEDQYFGGINLRYGSSKFNFFIEGIYERVQSVDKNTIAYGGSYKISSDLLLEFGLRTEYNKDFKFKNLKPIVKFCWITKK